MERPRSKILLYLFPGSRVDINEPLDLGQALTAFSTTGRENLASALGRLTRTITNFPFPLDLRRLPCHLHDFLFLSTEMSEYYIKFRPLLSSVAEVLQIG